VKDKRVLLVIGGGIAAYKCLELIRRLRERGVGVGVVLTRAGAEFVTPLSLTVLAGEAVHTALFDPKDEAEIGHIELSRRADLIVVAPATADLIAKMAGGHADDLASTMLLATDKRVLVAPAMNVRMWEHAATKRNVARIVADGAVLVGPNEGSMACNEHGYGRMAEPEEILAAIERLLSPEAAARVRPARTGPLSGCRMLITTGPTHEPIDPVRYIANRSSGKQGAAIAKAAVAAGAEVVVVSGPTGLPDPDGATVVRVETARQMLAAVEAALPADVVICAAAVADWRTASEAGEKIKKGAAKAPPALALVENPDILRTISKAGPRRPALVVGFAAETQDVVANAVKKRRTKGCDWIVANDVSTESGVMGGERNTVHLITSKGQESWPEMTKDAVAEALIERVAAVFRKGRAAAE
jgi:phosphopantothenoylcysteine decarboxylase/phosphopantothenate--cysteine ligase